MTDLSGSRLYDLLPPNLQTPENQALSYAVDRQFRALLAWTGKVVIYPQIMAADNALCDFLARVSDITEAYDFGADLQTKRKMIAVGLRYASKRGSAAAVREFLGAVLEAPVMLEWYQYNGEPHHFMIETESASLSPEQLDRILPMLEDVKRLSSWLDGIRIVFRGNNEIYAGMIVQEHSVEEHYMGTERLCLYGAMVVYEHTTETSTMTKEES